MDARGLLALIRAVTILILQCCKKGFASFSVEFQRRDAHTILVILKHGDHEPYVIPLRQVEAYLTNHPELG